MQIIHTYIHTVCRVLYGSSESYEDKPKKHFKYISKSNNCCKLKHLLFLICYKM